MIGLRRDATSVEGAHTTDPGSPDTRLRGARVRLGAPAKAVQFYRHGWQSWSPTWWVDPRTRPARPPVALPMGDDPELARAERHTGSGVGALALADGRVLLLGALDLGARVSVEDDVLHGEFDNAEGDWFAALGSELGVFDRYAEQLRARFGAHPGGTTQRVWCSWYSFYQDISEARLLDVRRGLAGLDFEVFQIDDGWQIEVGDWTANDRFPSGMASLASDIRDAGYRPGLWLAPFVAHERSQTFAAHPEWFLRDGGDAVSAGHNWGGAFHALDLTHPGACDHVATIIADAVCWGYEYLKLDFLYAAALPGDRREDIGREAAYRRGVELIREVAGDSVYLLACGAPVLPSIGVFDGLRIGPDVAPWWENEDVTRVLRALAKPNSRYALITSLHRLWLKPLVDLDPDVAYFRTRYNLLTPPQRAWLQDLARICGFKGTSDPPEWLDPDERAALAAFLGDDGHVRQLSRYRFAIGDRTVDFSPEALPHPDHLCEAVEP